VFGGVYGLGLDGNCGSCSTKNPFTNDCSCPGGFEAAPLLTPSACPTSQLVFCEATALPPGDYAGNYQPPSASMPICTGNPFMQDDCACDSDTTAVPILTLDVTSSICVRTGAVVSTFGGVFQKDSSCRAPNPRTSDCTCPAGTTPRDYPGIVNDGASSQPSTISFCMP
jgi:hypothetical protein